MALSRSEAEAHGVSFTHEGESYPSDPDQEVWAASATLDGHTEHIQGKSEQDVLDQAERLLIARKRIGRKPEVAEAEPQPTQSADVASDEPDEQRRSSEPEGSPEPEAA